MKAPGTAPLNTPQPLEVRAIPQPDGDRPTAVCVRGRWHEVASIEDVWRVDDEWWTETEISRTYFDAQLADGRRLTFFQDRLSGAWYAQRA
jgi:hypothetical protein